jgi:hypothetical protein
MVSANGSSRTEVSLSREPINTDRSLAGARLRYPSGMVRKIQTAIRIILMAFVAYGIIYQFPC